MVFPTIEHNKGLNSTLNRAYGRQRPTVPRKLVDGHSHFCDRCSWWRFAVPLACAGVNWAERRNQSLSFSTKYRYNGPRVYTVSFVDRRMTNPYEVTSTHSTIPRSPWHYTLAFIAGVVGYGTLFVVLGGTAWLTHGSIAAFDNLGRVIRIHREMSLNTIVSHIPHLVLATIVAIATMKWIDSHSSQSRWWMLAILMIIGYTAALLFTGNVLPWTWPKELINGARSAFTLLFPIVGYIIARLLERRTDESSHSTDRPTI